MDKNIYTEYKETISVRTCMMMSKPNPEETRMGNDTHKHTHHGPGEYIESIGTRYVDDDL